MINGIVNVYKERGYTSFDVVAKMRGIFQMRKIGHTGTLDPDAEGVLPVCLGKATKVCGLLTEKDKEYEAVMLLGTVTDTQDISGTVQKQTDVAATPQEVREAVESFVGGYLQTPPMYSALKVDGKKLCDLARAGVTVERRARPVKIYEIAILEIDLPRVRMKVSCSKGTYIRTLCHDIGETLGCGACMESLVRTRVSFFRVEDSLRLSEIEALVQKETGPFSFLHSVDSVFGQYKKAVVRQEYSKLLYNGNCLLETMMLPEAEQTLKDGFAAQTAEERELIRIYDEEGHFIGIYERGASGCKPVKIFMEL